MATRLEISYLLFTLRPVSESIVSTVVMKLVLLSMALVFGKDLLLFVETEK
jgi:hypothetical protein